MAAEKNLHAMDLTGFWMDVGQPKDFLIGIGLYLSSLRKKCPAELFTGPNIVGNVLIDSSVRIGEGCKIGPNVTLGEGVTIGDGVRIKNAVVLKNACVRDFAWIERSIIGWNSTVGRWVRRIPYQSTSER